MIIRALISALCFYLLLAVPADAGPGEDCDNSREPDIKIRGCTTLLQQPAPPQRRAAQYNNRCIAYSDKGEHQRAIEDCTAAIAIEPRNAFAHNNRCLLYNKLGQFDAAIADCTKSIELKNSAPQFPLKNRADAYVGKGEFEKAIADYTKSVDLMPSFDLASQALAAAIAARDRAAGGKAGREQVDIVPIVPHSDWVQGVAVSPDRSLMASGSKDGKVKIWDIRSRRLIRTIRGHEGGISAVAFTPDGKSVLSGGNDTGVKLWDVQTGRFIRHYFGHTKAVTAIAVSSDGQRIASASYDQTVVIWELASQKRVFTFKGHRGSVLSVAFSRDGSRVLSGADEQLYPKQTDFSAKLWEVGTGQVLRSFQHAQGVAAVALSPDGRLALSGSEDKTVKLWDISSGNVVRSIGGFEYGVYAVAFAPDGKTFFTGAIGGLKVWETASGRELQALTETGIRSLATDTNGQLLVAGTTDNDIKFWRLADGRWMEEPSSTLMLGDAPISLSPSGDATTFAVGMSAALHLWQVPNGVRSVRIPASRVAYSADASRVIAGGDQSLVAVDPATGKVLQSFAGVPGYIETVAISPDGTRIAAGLGFHSTRDGEKSQQGSIKLWDAASGKLLRTLSGHPSGIGSLVFTPDGTQLISGGHKDGQHDAKNGSGKLRYWNPATGQLLRTVDAHFYQITSMALSPDGNRLVTGSGYDPIAQGLLVKTLETVRIWDTKSGRMLHSMGSHAAVSTVAFAPDGLHVLSGSDNNEVMLWDVATGALVRRFDGHSGAVKAVQFSRDGKLVVSAAQDRTVRIWNRNTGALLTTLMGDQSGWLAVTPPGFFANSAPDDAAALTVTRGVQIYDINQMYQALYEPDLVRENVLGDPDKEVHKAAAVLDLAAVIDSGPPPAVDVLALPEETSDELLTVTARLSDQGGGLGRIEWRVNGITVAVNNPDGKGQAEWLVSQTLALDAGANTIEVIAYNAKNLLSSSPSRVSVRNSRAADLLKPTLHVVTIGINSYTDKGWKSDRTGKVESFEPLALAVDDANAVAEALMRAGKNHYASVNIVRLLDAQATRTDLEAAIDRLALEAHPRDTLVLFVAAHGISHNGSFYLIPHEYDGGTDPAALSQRAIGQAQLQDWITRIKAKRAIVLLDTCESGALISGVTHSSANLPASEAAIGRLHQATGRPVLTAAAEGKPAFEGHEGHGIFTWALLDALKKGDRNGNGFIELSELVAHVQSEVPKISARQNGRGHASFAARGAADDRQSARFGSRGEDFPLVSVAP